MLSAIARLGSALMYVFQLLSSTFWLVIALLYAKRGGDHWIRTIVGCWLSVVVRAGNPSYIIGIAIAAFLGVRSGNREISVVEFGVGRGGGMISMLKISRIFSKVLNMKIRVVGVDNGKGLPRPKDSRDHPEIWREGEFRLSDSDMLPRLKRLLSNKKARIVIGDLETDMERIAASVSDGSTQVGFISIDVDYYSSTKPILDWISRSDTRSFIDYCPIYFDDTESLWSFNRFSGQELAIQEFNKMSNRFYLENKHKSLKLYSLVDRVTSGKVVFNDLALPHGMLARIVSPKMQGWI